MLTTAAALASTRRVLGAPANPFAESPTSEAHNSVTLIRYPQKTDLILRTDRPPQLETPLRYFESDLTPNEAFFVRWHVSGIPTKVDPQSYRLEIGGAVEKPLSLSLDELKNKYEPVSLVALAQCSGNSRSFFEPRVPGGQWGHGAMGNARWTGVRLKDVLNEAGVKAGVVQVGLRGLDVPPMPATPVFQKSLEIDHARDGEVMIAYAMNDDELPMLNGFPLRLVVPGWYSTYWVKSLSSITVVDQPLKTFWMDKAYRIVDNPEGNEDPQHLAATTVPVSNMCVHSIFVRPEPGERIKAGASHTLRGVATDGIAGIRKVEVSTDGGKTWRDATLGKDLGKYSWRTWQLPWTPGPGAYKLLVRATAVDGRTQATSQWNRSGYNRNVIEQVEVAVA